jgi:hypothetical protein
MNLFEKAYSGLINESELKETEVIETNSNEKIANKPGKYERFSGKVDFYGTKGTVLNATFELKKETRYIYFWQGTWVDGIWDRGYFYYGIWLNGTWKTGMWHDGIWVDGIWEDGTWYRGTWKDGTWKGGQFESGRWYNGSWLRGWWHNGSWHGGSWRRGKIFIPFVKNGKVDLKIVDIFEPPTNETIEKVTAETLKKLEL